MDKAITSPNIVQQKKKPTNAPITTHMCFNLLQLLGLSKSNELTLSQNGYHVYIK
jgi:hypothetical protein